ncbi:MFS transporter [Pseudomonas sp. GX19020]|uniref:MFS transporter n=1 Tax=Pseudomonas sp. GX19020 TaxID=2942277 RepID=UPI002018B1DB|nr:MFS transporter [Pseudomonas sp. GX19020]MCL4067911.1 MFS transporter [Pseudomonas sp. GX19020]
MASQTETGGPGLMRLDEAPMRPVHILAAAAVLGGAALDGYVLGIVGPALALAKQEMELSALGQGLIAASALIGVFIGGLFFGNLADRFGRRPVFSWNLLAFVLLSLLQLFVQEVWQLVLLRLALGLAVGVEYAVGTSVLAEFSRRKGRGVLLGSFAVGWQVGFTIAFVYGNLIYSGDNWRLLLATSAIPALMVFLLRIGLPETPMWLKARGRDAEAQAVVERHFGKGFAIPDVELKLNQPSARDLLKGPNVRQHLYSGLFWFCQVGPFFAIFTFIGPVFDSLGIEDQTTVDIWLNLMQILGAVFGLFLIAWLSRRHFVISTFAVMFVTLLAIGLFPQAPIWVIVGLFAVYMFVAPAANNIQYVYPAEIFDTHLRSTGVGFSAAFSRISAAAAVYLLPYALETLGASAALMIMAGLPLLGLVMSILWAPETKRKALL